LWHGLANAASIRHHDHAWRELVVQAVPAATEHATLLADEAMEAIRRERQALGKIGLSCNLCSFENQQQVCAGIRDLIG